MRLVFDIDQELPGSTAMTVTADVTLSNQFLVQRVGLPQGPKRTFGGRLPEGVDLLEEVSSLSATQQVHGRFFTEAVSCHAGTRCHCGHQSCSQPGPARVQATAPATAPVSASASQLTL